jgi:asparagine synthase (glutamine-hydrolysing)
MASGGLDSAAVATTAARLSRSTVHLLTAAPDEAAPVLRRRHRYADERPYVQALAAMHPGLSLEVIACSTPDMLHQDGTALFLGTQAPVGPDGALGWFEPVFRRAAALGATVLLTGDMGEQSLSNSGIFRLRQLFLQGRWLALAHELRRLQDPSPGGALTYFRGHVLSTFVPPALRAARHRATGRGLFGNWHAYAALRPEIAARHGLSARMVANGFPGGDIGQYKGVAPLADWLLKRQRFVSGYAGAVRAMHGLALSQPLGDRRLIEFCAGLPADQFLRDGVPRRLIRQVLADRAPASIADNPCKGEQNPEWFHRLSQRREEIAGELDRLAASPLAARILDLPRLKALLDDWPADAEAAARRGPAYSGMLPRALHVGQFLRWVEGGNG